MKVEADGLAPTQTKIGEITYLTAGDTRPVVADEPWSVPISPLAVFSPGPGGWVLPVDIAINDKPPTAETIQTAGAVQGGRARAAWNGLDGRIVTGHVLDTAATPELRDIPAGIDRVVVAVDDANVPIDEQIMGAPVTAAMQGFTQNLGIITGLDGARRWVIVDLIGPFLARQNAELVVAR